MTLRELIKKINGDYDDQTYSSFPTFASSQKAVINLIDLYWMSKYRDDNKDEFGQTKTFYNINQSPTFVSQKMIDFDTKDVVIIAEEGQSYYPAWLLSKDIKVWMKNNEIGELFNKVGENLPKYGSVVLKKAKGKVFLVPIQNIRNEQTAETLSKSVGVIENHNSLDVDILAKNWEGAKAGVDKYGKDGRLKLLEITANVDVSDYPGLNYFIVAGFDKDKDNEGIVLHKAQQDDFPYKELHWDKLPGRWLGQGQPEKVFHPQIHLNKINYYKTHGLYWTSKHIYQTRDDRVSSNLFTEVNDGRILKVKSEIIPIATEERNLHAYSQEEKRWDQNISKLTFDFDVIRGEALPSGTPLGSAMLQSRMAGGFFDLKREEVGLFWKSVLWDWVIPQFKKTAKKRHKLMLEGGEFDDDELDNFRDLIINHRNNLEIVDFIKKNGVIPDFEMRQMIKSITREKVLKEKDIEIPDGYYDNAKYKLDIVMTMESVDMTAKMNTLQTIITIVGQNPTVLQDKRVRKVFYKLIDMAGISPVSFGIDQESDMDEIATRGVAERGGSVAKVTPVATPTPSREIKRI